MRASDYPRICANCKWWDVDEWPCRVDIGGCHRYPPSIISPEHSYTNGEPDLVYFPATNGDGWCGEFAIMRQPRVMGEGASKFADAQAAAPALAFGA